MKSINSLNKKQFSVLLQIAIVLPLLTFLPACRTTTIKGSSQKAFEAHVDEQSLSLALEYNRALKKTQADVWTNSAELFEKYWSAKNISGLYSSVTGPADAYRDKNAAIPVLLAKDVISDTEMNLMLLNIAESAKVRMAETLRDNMCDNPRAPFVKQVSVVISNNDDCILVKTSPDAEQLLSKMSVRITQMIQNRGWLGKIFPINQKNQVARLRRQCFSNFSQSCEDFIAKNTTLFMLSENPVDYMVKNEADGVMSEKEYDQRLLQIQRYLGKARTMECATSMTLALLRDHYSGSIIEAYRDSRQGAIDRTMNALRTATPLLSNNDEAEFRKNLIAAIKIEVQECKNEYLANANDYSDITAPLGTVNMHSAIVGGDIPVSSDKWEIFSETMDVADIGGLVAGQALVYYGVLSIPETGLLGVGAAACGVVWTGACLTKDFIINPIKDDEKIASLKEISHANVVMAIFYNKKSGVVVAVIPAVEKTFGGTAGGKM